MEILLFWIGLAFFTLGIWIVRSDQAQRRDSRSVQGVIVGFSRGKQSEPTSASFYPVVQFTGDDGRAQYVEGIVGSTSPIGAVGQHINVLIKRDNSGVALDSKQTGTIGAIFAAIGAICAISFFFIFKLNPASVLMSVLTTGGVLFQLNRIRSFIFAKFDGLKTGQPNTNQSQSEGSFDSVLAKVSAASKEAMKSRVFTEETKTQIPWVKPEVITVTYQRDRKTAAVAIPILIAIGCASGFGALYFYSKTSAFLKVAATTDGHVINMVERSGSDSTTWAPVIEFTVNDVPYRFTHGVSSSPPSYSIGENVRVLFHPRNPDDARLENGIWKFAPTLGLGALAAMMFLFAFLSLKKTYADASNPLNPAVPIGSRASGDFRPPNSTNRFGT